MKKTLITFVISLFIFSCGSNQEMKIEPNDEKEAKAFFGRHPDLSAPLIVFDTTFSGKTGIGTTDPNYLIDIFWIGKRVAFLDEDLAWVIVDSVATLKALNEVAETFKKN